jgi:hypothetical protein
MAAELTLVLRDFCPDAVAAVPAAGRPRLPALETLLANARRSEQPGGWRAALALRFGAALAGLSPAALVARAAGEIAVPAAATGTAAWLATPVHYFAGLDSVHLHPAGLLELSPQDQAALVTEFDAVFGGASWQLHATGTRELLLLGPLLEADGGDPAEFLGSKLTREQPGGAQPGQLRRLGVEIEMWLYEHSLNRRRQAAGELPVSGLWLWGSRPLASGRDQRHASGGAVPLLQGRDTFAEALWRLLGAAAAELPEKFATSPTPAARVVLYPAGAADFERFESDWLAPALQALRSRALSGIELLAGRHVFRLRRLALARFWRTCAPWHEALARA